MSSTSPDTASTPSALSAEDRAVIAAMGYEQARDELINIVQKLEAGAPSLEASLALWERGEVLAQHCQAWLDGARKRLDAVANQIDADNK